MCRLMTAIFILSLTLPSSYGMEHTIHIEESSVVSEGVHHANPVRIGLLHSPHNNVGHSRIVFIVKNIGKLPMNIPLCPTRGMSGYALHIQVVRGNAELFPDISELPRSPEWIGNPGPALQPISPRGSQGFDPSFTPWVSGTYEFRIVLQNDRTEYNTGFIRRITVDGLMAPVEGYQMSPIPNAWVGRAIISGRMNVRCLSQHDKDHALEEFQKLANYEEGSSDHQLLFHYLKSYVLAYQTATIVRDGSAPVFERHKGIRSLSEMQHQYAVEFLQELHHELDEPVLRSAAVRGLNRITQHGAGYLAVDTIATIALDRNRPIHDRLLCIDSLGFLIATRAITADDGLIYEIPADVKAIASKALGELYATREEDAAEIGQMVEALRVDAD